MTGQRGDARQWDAEAAGFDEEPDHGLRDPRAREAWRSLLVSVLPRPPARVADLGCGTGTLTRLPVDEGYAVDGVDFSADMVARARAKVPEAVMVQGDAADPPLDRSAYDVVLSRHVLWALPDPAAALARWVGLLRRGGVRRTRRGLVVDRCRPHGGRGGAPQARRTPARRGPALARAPAVGKEIDDERYLLASRA